MRWWDPAEEEIRTKTQELASRQAVAELNQAQSNVITMIKKKDRFVLPLSWLITAQASYLIRLPKQITLNVAGLLKVSWKLLLARSWASRTLRIRNFRSNFDKRHPRFRATLHIISYILDQRWISNLRFVRVIIFGSTLFATTIPQLSVSGTESCGIVVVFTGRLRKSYPGAWFSNSESKRMCDERSETNYCWAKHRCMPMIRIC